MAVPLTSVPAPSCSSSSSSSSSTLPGVIALPDTQPSYPRCHHADLPRPQGPADSPNLGASWRVSKLGQADSLSLSLSLSLSPSLSPSLSLSLSVGKPYPPTLSVTQASPSLSSLLRGYIRNVKLHQTISAQHPHESQRERGG